MGDIIGFAVRRLASAFVTLFIVSLVIFSAVHALPGGYADVFLGAHPTEAAKARVEAQFGLDQPLPVQYLRWLGATLSGDFGTSLVTQKPVAEEFATRLPVTATIAVLATLMAVGIGLPLGIAGGTRLGEKRGGTLSRLGGAILISVPDFLVGTPLPPVGEQLRHLGHELLLPRRHLACVDAELARQLGRRSVALGGR